MTIPLFPDIVKENDLSPDAFGHETDTYCEEIHDAVKGWGADKSKVIEALATKDQTQRHKIALRYPELYEGKVLADVMKKEFSGDFGTLMQFLAMPADVAECAMLKKAMAGIGASANVIYSILCGRTNEEVDFIKKRYFELYTKDLTKHVGSELHGDMERLVMNALQASEEEFDPQFHTKEKAKEDAEKIYKSGQGKWLGTEEKAIFKIICAAPPAYCEMINQEYAELYGYTLEKALEKELGGNAMKGVLFTVGMKRKPYETMARLIKTACAGIGTDELLLICCIVRFQGAMKNVMPAHIELFSKSIHDRVRDECGGKLKDALLAVLNAVWPEEG